MGEIQEAPFYDTHFAADKRILLQSPWLGLYVVVANWLEARRETKWDGCILDLGCGNGHFAEYLYHRNMQRQYIGLDFSEAAIKRARDWMDVDGYRFELFDLRESLGEVFKFHSGTVVILETLEHLEEDRDLIESIPQGGHVIFSVPNYDSEGHIRWFDDLTQVYNRYGRWLDYRRFATVDLSPPDGRIIFVAEGWRR